MAVCEVLDSAFDDLLHHLHLAAEHSRLLADFVAVHERQLESLRGVVETVRCAKLREELLEGDTPLSESAGGGPFSVSGAPSMTLRAQDVDDGELPDSLHQVGVPASSSAGGALVSGASTVVVAAVPGSPGAEADDAPHHQVRVTLLPFWHQDLTSSTKSKKSTRRSATDEQKEREDQRNKEAQHHIQHYEEHARSLCVRYLVMEPCAPTRIIWDILSLFVVAYDLLTLPLQAFGYDETAMAKAIGPYTSVFWTIDIVMGFLQGFQDQGKVEKRPAQIALRYFKGWFVPDFLIVAVDWVMFFTKGSDDVASVARIGKAARMVRIIRMLRLLRLSKFKSILDHLGDIFHNENFQTCVSMLKLLCCLALGNHFIACVWYAYGNSFKDTYARSWYYELEEEDASMFYRYVCSFHWTIAQFTPAPMNIHPVNLAERLFSILLLFFGLIFFATFIGSVTATINTARASQRKRLNDQTLVRQFIMQNKIPWNMGQRITSYLRQTRHQHRQMEKRVLEHEAEQLSKLPEALSIQLHYEVYAPVLESHPLFFHSAEFHHDLVVDICHGAMEDMFLTYGMELFTIGAMCQHMYLIKEGQFEYRVWSTDDAVGVRQGEWVCELAIWAPWDHKGSLSAVGCCQVDALSVIELRRLVQRDGEAFSNLQNYARIQVEKAGIEEDAGEIINDLWGDFDQASTAATACYCDEWTEQAEEKSHHPSNSTAHMKGAFSAKRAATVDGALDATARPSDGGCA